jgi:hypothetical protein
LLPAVCRGLFGSNWTPTSLHDGIALPSIARSTQPLGAYVG